MTGGEKIPTFFFAGHVVCDVHNLRRSDGKTDCPWCQINDLRTELIEIIEAERTGVLDVWLSKRRAFLDHLIERTDPLKIRKS